MVHYDINDEDILNDRGGYPAEYVAGNSSNARGRSAAGAADGHLPSVSQHHSRHNDTDSSELLRERDSRDRDRDRDRDPRDRERMDPRDRERDLRERERIIAGSSSSEHRDRYPPQQLLATQSSRRGDRERDEYSPHRSGGNSRRVLNAM
jgi:hypothetical protein